MSAERRRRSRRASGAGIPDRALDTPRAFAPACVSAALNMRAEHLDRRGDLAQRGRRHLRGARKRLARDQAVAALGLALELELERERFRDRRGVAQQRGGVAGLELELDLADRLAPLAGDDVAAIDADLGARRAVDHDRGERRAKRVSNTVAARAARRARSRPVAARISSRGNAATSSRPRGAGISHSARALKPAPAEDSTFRVCSRRVPSRRKRNATPARRSRSFAVS